MNLVTFYLLRQFFDNLDFPVLSGFKISPTINDLAINQRCNPWQGARFY
jgi:hypothetical protein